jgi:hypothetical protein
MELTLLLLVQALIEKEILPTYQDRAGLLTWFFIRGYLFLAPGGPVVP